MKNNNVEMVEFFGNEESSNIKNFLYRLLPKWYWFIICAFLGSLGGFIISKYTQSWYDVKTVLLVEKDSKGMGAENLFEGMQFGTKNNIQNYIGILKSYTLNLKTLENLDWKTSCYRKEPFSDIDLYGKQPFTIEFIENSNNLKGLPIAVEILSEKYCNIKIIGRRWINGKQTEINVDSRVRFGEVFRNDLFSFKINSTQYCEKGEYIFHFNDLENLALSYVHKLNVNLVNKNSELIRLSMQGNIPQRQVDYLNELSRVFIRFGLDQKNMISRNTVQFIDQQLKGLVDSLRGTGKTFSDFRTRNRTMDLSKEAEMIAEQLKEIETKESTIELQIEYYKNLLQYVADASQMNKIIAPSFVGIVDVNLNSNISKLIDLYTKKVTLSHIAKKDNPSLILLEEEIRNILLIIEENIRNLLANTKSEYKRLQTKKSEVTIKLTGLPETEQELINIKRRFDLNNELYTFLLKKRAEAAITTASNIADVRVLDPARRKTVVRIGPRTFNNIIKGLILGLSIPLIIIMMFDFFNDKIRSKDDLEREAKLPILGEIARNNYKEELAIINHPRSALAESFRGVRTNLQYILKNKPQAVIGLHSMLPGEGKTFNAVNLAVIIAMNNKKVLLVGCDMRKPRIQNIFEVKNSIGLSTFLIGQNSFSDVVMESNIDNLNFVNSGPIPPNPSELIETERFNEFIQSAKDKFDYVILDNAPVTLVSDGILAGKHADANLFVLRQGYSHRNQIKYINHLAEKDNLNNLCIILNDASYSSYGSSYSNYGYGYGYGYYDEDHVKQSWYQKLKSKISKK